MNTRNKKTIIYTCVVVPAAVTSGVISGLSSVVASYFFKPLWIKITNYFHK